MSAYLLRSLGSRKRIPECVAEQEAGVEDNQIVFVEGDYHYSLGPECYFCGAEVGGESNWTPERDDVRAPSGSG